MKPVIYIGADHAGFDMKTMIKEHLDLQGYTVEDLGAPTLDPTDDYPVYAEAVALAVTAHTGSLGVLSCGNAEGVTIVANKFDGIRAGIGFSVEAAKTLREDDAANVIAIPGRIKTEDNPLAILDAFLEAGISHASRHERRRGQIVRIEHAAPIDILPSILEHSFEAFAKKITDSRIRKLANMWHVDILDGSLFSATSFHDADHVATLEPLPPIELHLMIEQPVAVAKTWVDHIPSVMRAIVHAEISDPMEEVIAALQDLGLEVGLALNPETSVDRIEPFLSLIENVLIMGVHPGRSGQAFLGEPILNKIADLHARTPDLPIEVDGGVNRDTIRSMIDAGATRCAAASALWNENDTEHAWQQLTLPLTNV